MGETAAGGLLRERMGETAADGLLRERAGRGTWAGSREAHLSQVSKRLVASEASGGTTRLLLHHDREAHRAPHFT